MAMGKAQGPMIAVCGLDCGECDIYRAPSDPGAAQRVVAWFREQGWLREDEGIQEIIGRSMYCMGCRGDPSLHWSPDCWIRACCVDEKGLEFCYECDVFPCEALVEWAQEDAGYTRALNRLRRMKAE
ncbi:MAG: DUF3795 domain-containing protein [Chloroflexi bacterium]|nr:DUF3795 domain-containing protein [Chloroflexota bacterium]